MDMELSNNENQFHLQCNLKGRRVWRVDEVFQFTLFNMATSKARMLSE